MKNKGTSSYPEISDLLARKAKGREESAKLSFSEKIDRMEALRERLAPFRAARAGRKT
jgi:hypothetical protein